MAFGVRVDASDAILVSGDVADGDAQFGGVTFTGGDHGEGFVLKLAPSGDALWTRAFRSANDWNAPLVVSATPSPDGRVDISGAPFAGVDFGGGHVEPHAGIVASLDAQGAVSWTSALSGGVFGGPTIIDATGRLSVITNSAGQNGTVIGLSAFDPGGVPLFSSVFRARAAAEQLAVHGAFGSRSSGSPTHRSTSAPGCSSGPGVTTQRRARRGLEPVAAGPRSRITHLRGCTPAHGQEASTRQRAFAAEPRVGAPRCEMRASPSTPMHRRVSQLPCSHCLDLSD